MALFTVAEARVWDRGQLSDAALFPDAVITAKEVSLRARFESYIGVCLSSTTHTEFYDGDGTDTLPLRHHNPNAAATPAPVTLTSITVIGTDDSETAFTAAELADVVKYNDKLVRRSGTFTAGYRNIKVVYATGYTTVPEDLKLAAIRAAVLELVPTSRPTGFTGGTDGPVTYEHIVDEKRGRYFGIAEIDSPIRYHQSKEGASGTQYVPGIA